MSEDEVSARRRIVDGVRAERQARNQAILDGRLRSTDDAEIWCTFCASWYMERHDHSPDDPAWRCWRSNAPGCPCIVCFVIAAQARRVAALVAEADTAPPWRPESRATAEAALGRPLGPRERVRRLPDGTILPPASFTISGRVLDRLESHCRRLNLDRELCLDALMSYAEGIFS